MQVAAPNHQQQQPPAQVLHPPGVAAAAAVVPRTHTCISCQVPIALQGRLLPCKHAFCLECATEMPKCVICCANITAVERVVQPLFVSSLSQRTFFSEQDLQLDTRQMFRRVQNVPALAEAYQQYHQKQGQQGGQGSLRPPGQLQQL